MDRKLASVSRPVAPIQQARAEFAGPDAFRSYQRVFGPGADATMAGPEVFAAVHARVAGALVFTRRSLWNVTHSRDAARVQRNAFDHVTLGFVHAGEFELQTDGAARRVPPGSVILLDMTRPARHTARAEMTTLSLPRTLIARTAPWSRLHGMVLAGAGAAALNAWLDLDSHGPQAEAMLACLLEAVLHAPGAELAHSSAPADDRQDRVRERIEAELGEETLSPARLARQLNMSRATLYRAFQPLGPIHRWRRNRRLLHFKALLTMGDATVTQAAFEAGFDSLARASSLFASQFGLPPSRYRSNAVAHRAGLACAADLALLYDSIPAVTLRGRTGAASEL